MRYIKFFEDISVDDVLLVGGKGLSLGRMVGARLPVPPGFVIITKLHEEFKASGVLDAATASEILEAFDTLGAERVAVRSSAISEDSKTASWAGQFESYMNVERTGLIDAIKECWASVKSANDYAQTQGLDEDALLLGVVVQQMVDSDVSGVAFSVNPINNVPDEIMVEATYGLGEPLVQGMITPDNYILSKSAKNIVSKHIAQKTQMLAYKDSETKDIPVPSHMKSEPCLTDARLSELCILIESIEDYYGEPQDVEWSLHNDNFFILQSRPITTIS